MQIYIALGQIDYDIIGYELSKQGEKSCLSMDPLKKHTLEYVGT